MSQVLALADGGPRESVRGPRTLRQAPLLLPLEGGRQGPHTAPRGREDLHPRFEGERRLTDPGARYTSTERLVGLVLLGHLNGAGAAWPRRETLAARSGLSSRAVQRALKTLCSGPAALFERSLRCGKPVYTLTRGEQLRLPFDEGGGDTQSPPGETHSLPNRPIEQTNNTRTPPAAVSVGPPPHGGPPEEMSPDEPTVRVRPDLAGVREELGVLVDSVLEAGRAAGVELDPREELLAASRFSTGGQTRAFGSPGECPRPAWGRTTVSRLEVRAAELRSSSLIWGTG